MVAVRYERVTALPANPLANTFYFVRPSAEADRIEAYVTGNDRVPLPYSGKSAVQDLFDAGLIDAPTADALYAPIDAAISTSRAVLTRFGYSDAAVAGHAMEIALLNAGVHQLVVSNLASPPDEAAIRWTNGAPVVPGDALATFIQATIGYSSVQMAALFVAARQIV